MYTCSICKNQFIPYNIKRPSKTCSKVCKNLLSREITKKQFEDPAAREVQRKKSIEQKKSEIYQSKFIKSIEERDARWKLNGHPRTGKTHKEDSKLAIGTANTGRFKGKTWGEIFGAEVARQRREQNSVSMSKKNEILLKERRSNLETKLLPYLKEYENNVQIGSYNVDFLNRRTNHIIEVYGNYWHCNPKIYESNFLNTKTQMTAKEQQEKDIRRIKILEKQGYKVTVIWESNLNEYIDSLRNP